MPPIADKHDLDAARRLAAMDREDRAAHYGEILEWLQDINWPVARILAPLVHDATPAILPLIREILRGDDAVWKYWILTVLCDASRELREALIDDVIPLINAPSPADEAEEVHLVAGDLMVLYSFSV